MVPIGASFEMTGFSAFVECVGGRGPWLKAGSEQTERRSFGRAQAMEWLQVPRGAPSGSQRFVVWIFDSMKAAP
jgi:hypothetical protein